MAMVIELEVDAGFVYGERVMRSNVVSKRGLWRERESVGSREGRAVKASARIVSLVMVVVMVRRRLCTTRKAGDADVSRACFHCPRADRYVLSPHLSVLIFQTPFKWPVAFLTMLITRLILAQDTAVLERLHNGLARKPAVIMLSSRD